MNISELSDIAAGIVANGKGILAADESHPTIKKRFDGIGVENTETNRQAYRQMLFTTAGVSEYIGGVILFDETIRQKHDDGTPFPQLLANQGTVPGIKVDAGAKDLAGFPGEKITEGLDGLRERLAEYHDLGARFAKWRAVINISEDLPSRYCLGANAQSLARYAALCQEAGIVPIVEPEVIMDGGHSIETCESVTTDALNLLFDELVAANVLLEGTLLKPNMVISGTTNARQASAAEVAEATIRTLKRCVPSAIPGVVFLSGGQSEALATEHLSLMNQMSNLPWALSYSYGRALQQSALQAWGGDAKNLAAAQAAYLHRARCNTLAAKGEYQPAMEKAA